MASVATLTISDSLVSPSSLPNLEWAQPTMQAVMNASSGQGCAATNVGRGKAQVDATALSLRNDAHARNSQGWGRATPVARHGRTDERRVTGVTRPQR